MVSMRLRLDTELPLAVPTIEKHRFIDPVEVVIDKVIKLK